MLKNNRKLSKGFTLIEILVVMVILGILVTIGLASFVSAQARSRDVRRKSDLKQIATSLDLYYSDYEVYPTGSVDGKIKGCPSGTGVACVWGGTPSEFKDGKTTYMKIVPADPLLGYNYYYRTITVNSSVVGFQLYAHLENTKDINCLPDATGVANCSNPVIPAGVTCGGSSKCNFSLTSSNVTPTQ